MCVTTCLRVLVCVTTCLRVLVCVTTCLRVLVCVTTYLRVPRSSVDDVFIQTSCEVFMCVRCASECTNVAISVCLGVCMSVLTYLFQCVQVHLNMHLKHVCVPCVRCVYLDTFTYACGECG